MRISVGFVVFVLVLLLVALAGCAEKEPPKYAKETTSTPQTDSKTQMVDSEKEKQLKLLKTAKSGHITTFTKNWDEDAEDDGIVVYVTLKDEKDDTVMFEGVSLPVDIEIYTKEYENFKPVKGRLIYQGKAMITSWKDGNMFLSAGIRVPFEDIKAKESDDEFGILYVKVHLPDGRVIEAKEDFGVRIKPEIIGTRTPTPKPSEQEVVELELGESYKTSNLNVTVKAIKTNVIADEFGNRWAEEDSVFIVATVKVENTGSEKEYISTSDFWLTDESGRRYDAEIWSTGSGKLYPKEYRNLVVGFEVPKNAQKIFVKYNPSFGSQIAVWKGEVGHLKQMEPKIEIERGKIEGGTSFGEFVIKKVIFYATNKGNWPIYLGKVEVKYGGGSWEYLGYVREIIEPGEKKTIELSEYEYFETMPSVRVRFVDDDHVLAEGWAWI
ncbi:MAG: DUF4352 domain-containing protein [Archaeoglobus sp.]|nr:DUF4352 domain-containing protein [Archaeoglobus sp.]